MNMNDYGSSSSGETWREFCTVVMIVLIVTTLIALVTYFVHTKSQNSKQVEINRTSEVVPVKRNARPKSVVSTVSTNQTESSEALANELGLSFQTIIPIKIEKN